VLSGLKRFYCIASTFAALVDTDMTDSRQDMLRSAWLDAKDGSLSGREQAKAWALRKVWKDSGKADHGMKTFIAGKPKKKGGGSPSSGAVKQLFEKVDADDDWFPGKGNYEEVGAPSIMSGQQRGALARCAMAMKKTASSLPTATLSQLVQRPR